MLTFEWGAVLTGSAVVTTLVVFYTVDRDRDSPTTAPEPVRAEVKAERMAGAQPKPAPVAAARPKPARHSTFAFTASRGDAWLQVRTASFDGSVLYEGKLMQGESIRLRARRLWIRFGAASYVDLFIDGRRARLPAFGTYDAFAGPRGVVADRTDYATAAQSP
jgi:hypothetical protein